MKTESCKKKILWKEKKKYAFVMLEFTIKLKNKINKILIEKILN